MVHQRVERGVGVCTDCSKAMAVRIRGEETVEAVGRDGRCSCGGDEFDVLRNVPDPSAGP